MQDQDSAFLDASRLRARELLLSASQRGRMGSQIQDSYKIRRLDLSRIKNRRDRDGRAKRGGFERNARLRRREKARPVERSRRWKLPSDHRRCRQRRVESWSDMLRGSRRRTKRETHVENEVPPPEVDVSVVLKCKRRRAGSEKASTG